jgi:type I restriction enzyme M protein
MNHSDIVSFIWGVADLIRDTFKRGKYQDVILPLTVLRRLDCVLAPTKARVLETNARLRDKLDNLDPQLRRASGFAFYNTSLYDSNACWATRRTSPLTCATISTASAPICGRW